MSRLLGLLWDRLKVMCCISVSMVCWFCGLGLSIGVFS